jgi:hypothetical protein
MRASEILNEKAVESTWITNLTHNRPNKIVTMRLSNGRTFSIPGITRTTFDQWTKSPSKGKFWHDRIKNIYKATRIK